MSAPVPSYPPRNAESRKAVYEAIEAYCQKWPNIRLGQVIANCTPEGDPFYVEDLELAGMIRRVVDSPIPPGS